MAEFNPGNFLNGIFFAVLGISIFVSVFTLLHRFLPYRLTTEILEKQNLALAILLGAVSLGLCWIIAAAVH